MPASVSILQKSPNLFWSAYKINFVTIPSFIFDLLCKSLHPFHCKFFFRCKVYEKIIFLSTAPRYQISHLRPKDRVAVKYLSRWLDINFRISLLTSLVPIFPEWTFEILWQHRCLNTLTLLSWYFCWPAKPIWLLY